MKIWKTESVHTKRRDDYDEMNENRQRNGSNHPAYMYVYEDSLVSRGVQYFIQCLPPPKKKKEKKRRKRYDIV